MKGDLQLRLATKMKKETEHFLHFVDRELHLEKSLLVDNWKDYLRELPRIYNHDISFRLLFDWHIALKSGSGRAGIRRQSVDIEDPIFMKQAKLIHGAGKALHNLDYQYEKSTARTNLRGKSLLEIGGSLPNDLLFEYLELDSYVNVKSPVYIEAEQGSAHSSTHGTHERRRTIFSNAEEVDKKVKPESIDSIFSAACFEHIHDLAAALEACHDCSKEGGTLYSYIKPIYSNIEEGDLHVSMRNSLKSQLDFVFARRSEKEAY